MQYSHGLDYGWVCFHLKLKSAIPDLTFEGDYSLATWLYALWRLSRRRQEQLGLLLLIDTDFIRRDSSETISRFLCQEFLRLLEYEESEQRQNLSAACQLERENAKDEDMVS